jgi:hypothetical protein
MALRLLPLGAATLIKQNEVYGLPSVLVQVSTSVACQTSVDGTNWLAFTSDTVTAAAFIRCITANATVICKKFEGASQSLFNSLKLPDLPVEPPTPSDGAVIWLQKNPGGKTGLYVKFKTGPKFRLAEEP